MVHFTRWYGVLVCHQYEVCNHYVGCVYVWCGGLSESGVCVYLELVSVVLSHVDYGDDG